MNARIQMDKAGQVSLVAEGSGTAGPTGASDVRLTAGITVWVDPTDLGRIPSISVAPLEPQAEATLRELVGANAAERLVAAADAALWNSPVESAPVAVQLDTAVSADLGRLGFLLWLEQYTVMPLDQNALDIEIGTIATRLGAYGAWDLADERLARGYAHLITLARSHAAAAGDAGSGIHLGLVEALEAVLANDALDLSEAEQGEVRELSAKLSNAVVPDNVIPFLPRAVTSVMTPRESLALAASAKAADTEATYSIDTRRVPRDFLDADEDTITATWSAGEQLLRVRVPAAATAARASASLMFAVIDSDGRATAAGPLDFGDAAYFGECHLAAELRDGERVDVYSVLSQTPPATGAEWLRLAGVRQATRALQAERVAFASKGSLNAAARRWELAADGYETASAAASNPDAAADAERAATCAARAATLWALGDDDRETWAGRPIDLVLAELLYLASVAE